MDEQVPPEVVAERYERLAALVAEIALAENEALAGREVEVLVAEGEGRKDGVTHRMSGRARDNRLVHFAPTGTSPRPGDVVTTTVTSAAPHYLIADGAPLAVRRTRGGDAWQARHDGAETGGPDTGSTGTGSPGTGSAATGSTGTGSAATGSTGTQVLLGMPAVGAPAS
jgi:tRNA-2-methylthio-N6-dimethylallyladenosine synthase